MAAKALSAAHQKEAVILASATPGRHENSGRAKEQSFFLLPKGPYRLKVQTRKEIWLGFQCLLAVFGFPSASPSAANG